MQQDKECWWCHRCFHYVQCFCGYNGAHSICGCLCKHLHFFLMSLCIGMVHSWVKMSQKGRRKRNGNGMIFVNSRWWTAHFSSTHDDEVSTTFQIHIKFLFFIAINNNLFVFIIFNTYNDSNFVIILAYFDNSQVLQIYIYKLVKINSFLHSIHFYWYL